MDYRNVQDFDTERINVQDFDTERIVVNREGSRGAGMVMAVLVLVIGLIAAIWFIANNDVVTGTEDVNITIDEGLIGGGDGATIAPPATTAPPETTYAG